jgi:T5SS/PEP-CTERM-associated repeat protein/autotransporter-associated beta strand protein
LGAGYKGNGTLRIAEGVAVVSNFGYLGYNSGSIGTAMVTGTGSKWTSSYDLYVGKEGSGSLIVNDGGMVVVGGSIFASNLLGNGTISANGGVVDADLVFDAAHGLHGTSIFGSGGILTITPSASRTLGVGYKGNGTLRITEGVTVASSAGYLGYKSGSVGTATVTGTGSTWTNSIILIGYDGTGRLMIEEGGQVNNDGGVLGERFDSSGTATVTGTGSKWTNSGKIYVGRTGCGTLNIKGGGLVSNATCYLGNNSGSSGTVTVTGPGSMWTNSGVLYVGYSGKGTLNIGSGIASDGIVSAKSVTLANSSSATATCNLNGGTLQTSSITKGTGSTTVTWSDGTIRNYDASTDLTINGTNSLNLKLAATGTHDFYIDSGRTGTVLAILSDATSGGTLTKQGGGLLKLSAANTYTGSTTIAAGTLALSSTGSLASSSIDVKSGATFDVSAKSGYSLTAGKTLTGSGTIVGDLSVSGIHAPGNSTGIETVRGNYSLLGELQIELAGTTAGTGYDEVLLSGGSSAYKATLGGNLTLDWTGLSGASDSSKLWILKNNTSGTLSGTFSNYVNGASLGIHDGRPWYLYYGADSATGNLTGGNDVVIAAVPEPSSFILLAISALGLAAIASHQKKK